LREKIKEEKNAARQTDEKGNAVMRVVNASSIEDITSALQSYPQYKYILMLCFSTDNISADMTAKYDLIHYKLGDELSNNFSLVKYCIDKEIMMINVTLPQKTALASSTSLGDMLSKMGYRINVIEDTKEYNAQTFKTEYKSNPLNEHACILIVKKKALSDLLQGGQKNAMQSSEVGILMPMRKMVQNGYFDPQFPQGVGQDIMAKIIASNIVR